MAYKAYVDLGNNVIATDDDGDGTYDDVHNVTHGKGGILHYDGDGDGTFDDSIYGVKVGEGVDTSGESSHQRNVASYYGSDSNTIGLSAKQKHDISKIIIITLVAIGLLSNVGYFILALIIKML